MIVAAPLFPRTVCINLDKHSKVFEKILSVTLP